MKVLANNEHKLSCVFSTGRRNGNKINFQVFFPLVDVLDIGKQAHIKQIQTICTDEFTHTKPFVLSEMKPSDVYVRVFLIAAVP